MLKQNKLSVILSSLLILLPMLFGGLFWNNLPDIVAIHFGTDGNADGFGSKAFLVFGLPLCFFALHFLALLITSLDKGQKDQTKKALGLIFWTIPVISLFLSLTMYSVALGYDLYLPMLLPAFLGIALIFMGNYLPKVKQNSTLGIKVSWTLQNEENWNRTHRFGGKAMVVSGLIILFSALLPIEVSLILFICVLAAFAGLTTFYSYRIYRQHQKAGIEYAPRAKNKGEKIIAAVGAVVVSLLLIGIATVMFTGEIKVECGNEAVKIDATYYTGLSLDYSEIDAAEYRESFSVGRRTNGFGSAKLLLGIFENDEFGSYTLYAYSDAKEFVVLTSGGKRLVVGMRDPKDTQTIYNTLLEKIGEN